MIDPNTVWKAQSSANEGEAFKVAGFNPDGTVDLSHAVGIAGDAILAGDVVYLDRDMIFRLRPKGRRIIIELESELAGFGMPCLKHEGGMYLQDTSITATDLSQPEITIYYHPSEDPADLAKMVAEIVTKIEFTKAYGTRKE
jgi:hypothetical protein